MHSLTGSHYPICIESDIFNNFASDVITTEPTDIPRCNVIMDGCGMRVSDPCGVEDANPAVVSGFRAIQFLIGAKTLACTSTRHVIFVSTFTLADVSTRNRMNTYIASNLLSLYI